MKNDAMRQTCKLCLRPTKFDFHVPDDIWSAIVPDKYRNRVLCLPCFDDFAADRKLPYAKQMVRTMWFAGDAGNLIMEITSARDLTSGSCGLYL